MSTMSSSAPIDPPADPQGATAAEEDVEGQSTYVRLPIDPTEPMASWLAII